MQWSYSLIMLAAVAIGILLFRCMKNPLGLSGWEKFGIGVGAFCGSMIGAKLPFVLVDWEGFHTGAAWFHGGKTIMSGLVGAYVGVRVAKWVLGVRVRMGDTLVVPAAASIAVGRLACFHAGCCYGTVTALPWGIDFGDGLLRHPTQLYESAFHLLAAIVLYRLGRAGVLRGHLIRVYFISYFVYRFATEFIRPEPALWLGLSVYQFGSLVLAGLFALDMWWCSDVRQAAVRKRQREGVAHPGDDPACRTLKATRTLCPQCLRPVMGTTFERDGRVYLRRACPEHGTAVALVSSNRRHYYLRNEVPHPPSAKWCCCRGGLPEHGMPEHRTCVALLELTEACNLNCPVCFARSATGTHRPFAELCSDLDAFVTARGLLDVLQLSGGEPLLHPDLARIIDHAKTLPIGHVMINTNGLELIRRDSLAQELAQHKPRLELFLQMDGLDARSHLALRGVDLSEQKRAIIETIVRWDLPTTLACTVVKDVNEDQVGELLRLGLATPQLRGITYQPATWAGRFLLGTNPLDRITLADIVHLLVQQSEGLFREEDFNPLPCSNPNCCGFTFVFRPPKGRMIPLSRIIDYRDHLEQLSDRINFNLEDIRAYGGAECRADEFFRVIIKPFMDAYTYDEDRAEECCIHIIRPGGGAMSFCRYNTLGRNPSGPLERECPAVAAEQRADAEEDPCGTAAREQLAIGRRRDR